jgi:hypothetical protein
MWLRVAGLDCHTPLIGVRPRATMAPTSLTERAGAQHAFYRPICDFQRAGG